MTHPSHTQAIAMGPSIDKRALICASVHAQPAEAIADAMKVLAFMKALVTEKWEARVPGATIVSLLDQSLMSCTRPKLRGVLLRCLYVEFADKPVKGVETAVLIRWIEAWENKIWRRDGHVQLGLDRVTDHLKYAHDMKLAVRAATHPSVRDKRKKK